MGKKLYKKEEGKMLCGVCAGLAEYLRMDVSIVRLLCVILCLFASVGVWVYLACALILPWKDTTVVDGEVVDET